ncbi:NADP-specific glutamate dehydrogenase [Campylobacter hyointestinalis]|uniref:Glutamate dehydrogenase n=1 Tax=Campylobacter hyointestinalis subsp. hyointestinalis TaxID=91352 RepID=A0A855N6Q2_CAMHY|nr:NADP-specific glutamate dehydrogenase [Campylobacter hyointestinalis]MDL2346329.1 NADP-specific glutamate dehydrogenase [Campylobacter hyointestinalis]MDL2348069.1 NADP-specific glutamate dehydrogenase [Campylobacter hyointestinalis]MDL2349812.1 NADP-specific glutamate dehydrogenase [Campylobacter hyointestinalis]MDM1025511.1 NADP-specific glutamate dehydrogenase [Campylobacter hyointestinalis]MDM1027819.1 NADP-specific glutamate dehydrogenase [Campylobacter hyointestinalis]
MGVHDYINQTLEHIKRTSPGQTTFLQAATEILRSLEPLLSKEDKYLKHRIIDRIVMPERTTMFRVTYMNDKNEPCSHFGYRVEFNSALGPYKGGLRFHPSVCLDIIKFLGFEQIFKNSLTGLNMGGGKGGANFDPKGKSDGEIMRFCQSFMNELYKLIGDVKDVPAGDIGVGGREIGYMFGQYKKLTNRFDGALTGKGLNWGGSLARTEATGYGSVYFANEMLKKSGGSLEGKKCSVSGAGNVAIYTVEKLYEFGALPVTVSDSTGFVYDKDGIDTKLLKRLKEVERKGLIEYANEKKSAVFTPVSAYKEGTNGVWSVPCDAAFPSATQNELHLVDIKTLYNNGCRLVCEGANMPSTLDAIDFMLSKKDFLFGPAKAANAGGVATSGLEMAQNASMQKWTFDEVDKKLHNIMTNIFHESYDTSVEFGDAGNLVLGANIAGFRKVADAMIDQGYV